MQLLRLVIQLPGLVVHGVAETGDTVAWTGGTVAWTGGTVDGTGGTLAWIGDKFVRLLAQLLGL